MKKKEEDNNELFCSISCHKWKVILYIALLISIIHCVLYKSIFIIFDIFIYLIFIVIRLASQQKKIENLYITYFLAHINTNTKYSLF